jgi:flagellar hook assembly protein FlgD
VRIRVFDVTGRLVAVLRQDAEPAGNHAVAWNGRDSKGREAGSGIYFVKLDSEGQSRVRKIALTR